MRFLILALLRFLTRQIIQKYRPDVVAVTGSVGKTTTKDAIALILSNHKKVRSAERSLNSEIGLPLTVLGSENPGRNVFGWLKALFKGLATWIYAKDYPEVLVLEMAADKRGDIGYLCDLVKPKIGVVTAITPVHLHNFKTIEGVAREKRKLIECLPRSGLAVLNHDDERVLAMQSETPARVVTYGLDGAQIQAVDVSIRYRQGETFFDRINGLGFKLLVNESATPVTLPATVGYHHVYAMLAGIAVGLDYGLNPIEMADKLLNFKSAPGRLRLLAGINRTVILDDSYNASPAAVTRALEVLCDLRDPSNEPHRRVAVLGDMLELGNLTEAAHRELGQKCAELHVDYLITVGSSARLIAEVALAAGFTADQIQSLDDAGEAAKLVKVQLKPGDIVLVKGSRCMRMEQIVRQIMLEADKADELLVHGYS